MRSSRFGFTHHASAVVLAFVFLATSATGASASSTRSKISDAEQQLAALEAQLTAGEAAVAATQSSLRALASKLMRTRDQYDLLQAAFVQTQRERAEVAARLDALRTEIDRMAMRAYITGPSYYLNALVDVESLSDAADVIAYANDVASRDASLAGEAGKLSAELTERQARETDLIARQAAALKDLSRQRSALTARFAQEQMQLAGLAQARAKINSILSSLRKRLRAETVLRAERAAGRGTPLSFGQWATAFLRSIGAPVSQNNLVVMVAWQTAEYTSASWNPLATTYAMAGTTVFNTSGVRNYNSLEQGLQATIATLRRPGYGYEAILFDLAHNADPMTTAEAIRASRWCHGCARGQYVVYLVPSVQQYFEKYAAR